MDLATFKKLDKGEIKNQDFSGALLTSNLGGVFETFLVVSSPTGGVFGLYQDHEQLGKWKLTHGFRDLAGLIRYVCGGRTPTEEKLEKIHLFSCENVQAQLAVQQCPHESTIKDGRLVNRKGDNNGLIDF